MAWYALVHLAGSELAAARGRAGPGAGAGRLAGARAARRRARCWHVDELCGEPVDLDFVLHDPAEVLAAVTRAGLVDVEWYRRGPVGDTEARTERIYVLARRPPAEEYLGQTRRWST